MRANLARRRAFGGQRPPRWTSEVPIMGGMAGHADHFKQHRRLADSTRRKFFAAQENGFVRIAMTALVGNPIDAADRGQIARPIAPHGSGARTHTKIVLSNLDGELISARGE